MLDDILGRPSPTVRRSQIFLVLFFWIWRLYKGDGSTMGAQVSGWTRQTRVRRHRSLQNKAWWRRVWTFLVARRTGAPWMTNVNERLKYFTPYQLILGTLTVIYALRHLDDLLGLGAPEPLAALYTRSYYRATYINTALDAGFASAMTVRPKWLKDIASCVFAVYYMIYAKAGDDVLRRFRAFCSVEMLRTTWEKTNNPYIRWATRGFRPKLPVDRHVLIPRPKTSSRAKLPPVKALLLFAGTEEELANVTEIIIDFPGGGFVAMGPECHEERLRTWAKRTHKPVLSIDYGKAPEYPYPWAIEEGIDAYRTTMESHGQNLGIKSGRLSAVLTGDSAGGNICTTIMNRILEHHKHIPRPVALILAYPALDFNFTSWMSPDNLRVLQTEQSETNIPRLLAGKDHLRHKSPLSVVDDVPRRPSARRGKSWANTLGDKLGMTSMASSPAGRQRSASQGGSALRSRSTSRTRSPRGAQTQPGSPVMTKSMPRSMSTRISGWWGGFEDGSDKDSNNADDDISDMSDSDEERGHDNRRDADKSLLERVKTPGVHADERFTGGILATSPIKMDADEEDEAEEKVQAAVKRTKLGTRLTMTSRVGYFQDRIISPSMMRAMAILYVGPQNSPDFSTDYYISPLLTPPHLLADFPPVYAICGERDPFVDDTVIFAGRLRDAKRARRREAEKAADGQTPAGGKFGEGLRMSTGESKPATAPDHILRETDEDWVQMRIIQGWGHGFMQMSALMKEVDSVLIEMADWIDESFERAILLRQDQDDIAAAHADAATAVAVTSADMPSPLRARHVRPAREYKRTPANAKVGGADMGGLGFDGSDEEGLVTFTPKSKKRTPPPSAFMPVPRRPSKESLVRNNSVPRFDADDSASSGDTVVNTPPTGRSTFVLQPPQPKSQSFGLFSGPPKPRTFDRNASPATALYGTGLPARRPSPNPFGSRTPTPPKSTSPSSVTQHGALQNPIVKAAVAGAARAASPALPALAAAGLVPQRVENMSEAELLRRRRAEAVYGMQPDVE